MMQALRRHDVEGLNKALIANLAVQSITIKLNMWF